ncbi:MAG: hypothetical protein ACHQ2Y_01885 [Candidatus Lutacidiplasmatales archaeon]
MGEAGERVGTASAGGRRGVRGTVGLATLVLSVAAVMAFAPMGLAAHAGIVTIKAPYKGAVTPFTDLFLDGCGTAKVIHKYAFSLKSGAGGGSGSASAKTCGAGSGGVGQTSDNAVEGGFNVAIPVHFPVAGATGNVSVSVTETWAGIVKETAPANPNCTDALQQFAYNFAEYYNGASWSYSPNIAGPVNYTNSTFFYNYTDFGASSFCIAGAEIISELEAWITDLNTGVSTYQFSIPVDSFVETYNETYWYCYSYTEWDYGTWYNSTGTVCYSYNVTTLTESYQNGLLGTNTTLSSSGSSSSTMWFNQSYNLAHHFEVFLYSFDIILAEVQGWNHASASASMNHATLGNGVKLTSITLA